jgi:hypothetical protein
VSTSTKASLRPDPNKYRITARSPWAGKWRIAAGVGIFGLGIAAYGWKTDPSRFAFSYLFSYFVALSLPLGSVFFVMVQYATKSGWSVSVRRVAELLMRPMPIFAVLAIPLVLTIQLLFPWLGAKHHIEEASSHDTSAEHSSSDSPVAEERGFADREPAAFRDLPLASPTRMEHAEAREETEIIEHKQFLLNKKFFLARLILYLIVWSWIVHRYFKWSTDQDQDGALENTSAGQRFAPAGIILFAFTLTFFAFDWLLSLDGTWYSTIFGVYVFAQCAVFMFACLILMTLALRSAGLLGQAVTVEHFHDLGKFLFGFIVFWTYIAFAQFFLTWYSNIPDEVAWYHKRWADNGGTWQIISLALITLNFFVPFWFLMSRNIKRRLPLLAVGASCIVVMHIVEAYWIVMPNFGPMEPSFVDLGCLLGVFGVYMAFVLHGMEEYSLVAVGDPRLPRALEFENA